MSTSTIASNLTAALLGLAGSVTLVLILAVNLLSYGRAPCEDNSWVLYAQLAPVAALFAGVVIVIGQAGARRLRSALVMVAGLIAIGLLIAGVATRRDKVQQRACRTRSLPEQLALCRINPGHVRVTREKDWNVVTLVHPGTTDAAWHCLQRWANWSDHSPDLRIDQSVYDHFAAPHPTLMPQGHPPRPPVAPAPRP